MRQHPTCLRGKVGKRASALRINSSFLPILSFLSSVLLGLGLSLSDIDLQDGGLGQKCDIRVEVSDFKSRLVPPFRNLSEKERGNSGGDGRKDGKKLNGLFRPSGLSLPTNKRKGRQGKSRGKKEFHIDFNAECYPCCLVTICALRRSRKGSLRILAWRHPCNLPYPPPRPSLSNI